MCDAKNSCSIGFMPLSALAGCVYAHGRMRTTGRGAGAASRADVTQKVPG
ncbi:hypothetical protein ACFV29_20475 [Streptomyces sp. NPDC059690]